MRKFDWIPNHDPRSRKHPLRLAPRMVARPWRAYSWRKTVVLDQGAEGACSGFSMAHFLASRPKARDKITNTLGKRIYQEAKRQDEWPGEDYDGSSVNGACRAARKLGFIESWEWSFDLGTILAGLGYVGPCVIGMPWFEGMDEPDRFGIVRPTGKIVGGHAIEGGGTRVVNGTKCIRLPNSWGPEWGVGGDCFMPVDEFAKLLSRKHQVEVAFPKKP